MAPPPAGGPRQSKGACHQHRLEPSDSTASPGGTQSHPVWHLLSRPPHPQALGTLQPHGPPGLRGSSSISRHLPISGAFARAASSARCTLPSPFHLVNSNSPCSLSTSVTSVQKAPGKPPAPGRSSCLLIPRCLEALLRLAGAKPWSKLVREIPGETRSSPHVAH